MVQLEILCQSCRASTFVWGSVGSGVPLQRFGDLANERRTDSQFKLTTLPFGFSFQSPRVSEPLRIIGISVTLTAER